MLTDSQFNRYQRQICLSEIGEAGQSRLLNAKVLIVGCGGLGSVVAPYLVGAGVGHVVIADGDELELHNLHRQICYQESQLAAKKAQLLAQQLRTLNSEVKIRVIPRQVDELILGLEIAAVDLVLDCSDNLPTRHAINRICFAQQVPLISGAAIGWEGHLMMFNYAPEMPCYHCIVPSMADRHSCSELGVVGPVVGMIGNGQALLALQYLLESSSMPVNQLMRLDGKQLSWQTLSLHADPCCSVCASPSLVSQRQSVCS